MNRYDPQARELDALAGLADVVPGDAWERRVHARCRAALERPRRGSVAPRLLDAALVMALGFYLTAVVTEAVRLVGAG
jgi:hypothetical protein